jgi:Methyltransferase TRM13
LKRMEEVVQQMVKRLVKRLMGSERFMGMFGGKTEEEIWEYYFGLNISKTEELKGESKNAKGFDQLDTLIKVMKEHSILDKELVYLEYGAGKGKLSHCISEALQNQSSHVLIELERRRNKYDRFHR